MSENGELVEDNEVPVSALKRFYEQSGKDMESLRLSLSNYKDAGQYVYKVELRAPSAKSVEWLCIVKMMSEEGVFIAFNSGGSFYAALIGLASRLRAGKLEWHDDSYPPEDHAERLAYLHKNETWLMF